MSAAPARAAVLGGTFDPIHNGHLAVAEQVCRLTGADEVWLVPAAVPPHRQPAHASAADRLDLCRAATAGRPGMRVDDVELQRAGPSFTLDTMRVLEERHPTTELWFVLGADAARLIETWHRADEVRRRVRFVIVNRSGEPELDEAAATRLGFVPERTRIVVITSPPISATDVRRRAAAGEPLTGLVPDAVAALIRDRGLYRSHARARGIMSGHDAV